MVLQVWQRRVLLVSVGLLASLVITGSLISTIRWINRPFPGFFLYGNLDVGPDFLPGWSGEKAGLRFMDRIVAVQGKPVNRPQEIYDLVRDAPLHSFFLYTVERGERRFTVEVPSMRFTPLEWLLSYGVYLVVGVGFLVIGFPPFSLRSPAPSAAPLFFMVSAVFFWFATSFDFMTTQFIPKEVRAFAFALTPGAGLHLGLLLAKGSKDGKRYRLSLFLIYAASIAIGLLYSMNFYGPPGIWHGSLRLGYVYACLSAIIFLVLLSLALRRPITHLERSRLRVILAGASVGFFIPTFGTVLVSSFQWEIPHNLLLIAAVCFPLSVAYALVRYNLFVIDTVFKMTVTRSVLTGVLLLIYILVVLLVGAFFGGYGSESVTPVFFLIVVALIFNRLLRWVEDGVDHYVYRREYDPVGLQGEVSSILRTLSRPQAVGAKYLRIITERVLIQNTCLFFQGQDGGRYFGLSHNGSTNEVSGHALDLVSPWIGHFERRQKGISRDEVETDPVYQEDRVELLKIFHELKLEVLIPMLFEERLLGLVSLGKKKSGRGYSADDFRLLSNLADQLALCLRNGMLFEESERAKENYHLLYDKTLEMNRRLVEMDRLKKQFVANISHELRTPISTILGYTEVLLGAGLTGEHQVVLDRIITGGRDLSQLMDSLLDFSRIEAGKMESGLQGVNIVEICQSLETMARRLIKNRPVHFRMGIESSVTTVHTEAKKLQQILMHLLTNAVKFTERGEIALSVKDGEPGFVHISVSDTGVGIGEDDQEIIFEEFRQLDGSSTRKYGGTGLGLSLCRKLAQSLEAMIEVKSKRGEGSTFTLVLPVRSLRGEAAGLLGAV